MPSRRNNRPEALPGSRSTTRTPSAATTRLRVRATWPQRPVASPSEPTDSADASNIGSSGSTIVRDFMTFFYLTNVFKHQTVMVEQLALEADLVGADA
jgi:hypothetical protein